MSKIKFTDNQQEAIDVNEGNFLIAAAAGSGKTAVLSNRVVRLLTEGDNVSIDELVVLTFTNLSTFEMKERIGRILSEKILKEKSALSEIEDEKELVLARKKIEYYELQKLKLPNSRISTIDSLCSNLVKENFQKLGISSNMRTATGVELDLLKNQIADEVLELFYEKEDNEDFLKLVENFSLKDDNNLKKMVIDGYKFIRSFPYPFDYLDQALSYYTKPDAKNIYNNVLELINNDIDTCINIYEDGITIASGCTVTDEKYGTQMDIEKKAVKEVKEKLNSNEYSEAIILLYNIKFKTITGVTKADKEIRELCKAHRDKAKNLIKSLVTDYFSVFSNYEEDMKVQYEISKIYFELLKEYYNKLQDKKRELEIMDFADISFFTLELLSEKNDAGEYVKTSLATALSNGIKYIIVDECQDINKVQNTIFNLLSQDEQNIYMVGDVKQSIYKFRDASPELFIEKKTSKDSKTKTILLKDNFRSRDVICDIVNHIFKQIMSKEIGDIDYNEDEELICGRTDYFKNPNAIPELHIIDKQTTDENSSKVLEANYVAQTIKEMIDNKYEVLDENSKDGKSRICTAKDFAILSRSNNFKIYADALEELGITADFENQTSFFEDRDVTIMFNLLKVINNPQDEMALTAVLMSPLFAFSADLIAKIKLNRKNNNLWTGLFTLAKEKNLNKSDETKEIPYDKNCEEFYDLITIFRKKSASLSTTKLIQYLYEKTDFLALMSTQCDVEKIELNMNLFLNYTKEYESFSNNGVSGFINYVTNLKELKKDFEGVSPQINDSDSVKFLTIHKSKGLEFPICFLVNCDKKFNKRDIQGSDYLWDNTIGFATKIVNHENHNKYTTLPFESIRIKKDKEGVSEELRVLYVALTRAKEKLIMVGTMKSSSKNHTATKTKEAYVEITSVKRKIEQMLALINYPLKPTNVFEQTNFLNWLIISLLGKASFSKFEETKKYMIDEIVDDKVRLRIVNSFLINNGTPETTEKSTEIEKTTTDVINDKLIEKIKNQLSNKYANMELTSTPAKSTVTKLAKANFAKKSAIPIKLNSDLLFNNAKENDLVQKLTPAQRGTILHTFMQYANFENAIVDLDNEIETLITNKFLSKVQADNLNKESIQEFLKSTTYVDRMAVKENTIKREFKFNFFIPANMVNENVSSDDNNKVFVQGIADCLVFDKDGNITILDYKTDAIRSNEKAEDNKSYKARLTEQYKQQMVLYARALNDIFGEGKVIDAYLYSLAIAEEIEIDIK